MNGINLISVKHETLGSVELDAKYISLHSIIEVTISIGRKGDEILVIIFQVPDA